jgi:outer membrane protein OmpA-like peptidoglycan-associated protein
MLLRKFLAAGVALIGLQLAVGLFLGYGVFRANREYAEMQRSLTVLPSEVVSQIAATRTASGSIPPGPSWSDSDLKTVDRINSAVTGAIRGGVSSGPISNALAVGTEIATELIKGGVNAAAFPDRFREAFKARFPDAFAEGAIKGTAEALVEDINHLGRTLWEKLTAAPSELLTEERIRTIVNEAQQKMSEQIEQDYSNLLSAMANLTPQLNPSPPVNPNRRVPVIIYFPRSGSYGGIDIDRGIDAELPGIRAILASDQGCSLSVSGHTDTKGSSSVNERLSRLRAVYVATRLSERLHIAEPVIEGWGTHHLRVLTGEDVSEANNRRVEIAFSCAGPVSLTSNFANY